MNYYEEYNFDNNTKYGLLEFINYTYKVNNIEIINNRAIHNDIVYIENNKVVGIKTRNITKIAGILYLNKNTKYGFNSKHMPYYVFRPLNKKYPKFLVASSLKNQSKQYIVITFNKWPIDSKYPYGQCEQIIGSINDCKNIYEILLYKHNLIYPKFKIFKSLIQEHQSRIIKNTQYNVFTIDPDGCKDIDDAISFNMYDTYIEIGIHITDVSYYINDIYHLLYNLSSSIYASHRQINILPEIYATNICSLLEHTNRKCVSVILKFSHNYELINYNIKLTNVHIIKNFSYEEAEEIIKSFNNKNMSNTNYNKYKYLLDLWNFMTHYNKTITDTHILIEKLMILANHKIAEVLYNYDKNNTILRIHNMELDINKNAIVSNNNKLNEFVKLKTFSSAIYEKNITKPIHYGLNINLYTHFTSPIRRLCDIITHINIKNYLHKKNLLEISNENINHMNKVNKNIKKLYYDYKIVDLLNKFHNTQMVNCEGYIVEFTDKNFNIYIPEFDIEYKIKYYSNKLNNLYIILKSDTYLEIQYEDTVQKYKKYELVKLEMYFIENEDNLEDKIKIKII